MDKVIPILPCPDIKKLAEFYQQLGFEVKELFSSPNPYAVIQYQSIDLHFWGSRKNVPAENSSMCYIQVNDVDGLYNVFVSGLKKHTGKVPRSGLPRISKVRDLSSDRRFTLTDLGGNTLFIGTPTKSDTTTFFRTLENDEMAKKFAVLYDLLYSKEDPALAFKTWTKYQNGAGMLHDLDQAKYLLLVLDIQRQSGQPTDDKALKKLIKSHNKSGQDWDRIKERLSEIQSEE